VRTAADVTKSADVGPERGASFALLPRPPSQLSSKESPIASLFQGRVRSEVRPTGVTAMANYETFLLFNLDITVRPRARHGANISDGMARLTLVA